SLRRLDVPHTPSVRPALLSSSLVRRGLGALPSTPPLCRLLREHAADKADPPVEALEQHLTSDHLELTQFPTALPRNVHVRARHAMLECVQQRLLLSRRCGQRLPRFHAY